MAEAAAAPAGPARRQRPTYLRRFLELFVLCGFAVAQPLLDITGRSPETFLFLGVRGAEVALFALALVVVPPLLLWLVTSAVALMSAAAGRVVHALAAAALLALVLLQAGKGATALRGPLLVAIAVALAVAGVVLLARSSAVRTFVTFLVPAPLVFVLLFLLVSPVSGLVRPSAGTTSAAGTWTSASRPPVVMIVLDEMPLRSLLDSTGQVDEALFPNFARLSRQSHWFRNGTAVSGHTLIAVPPMVTGRYPDRERNPSFSDFPDSVFSLLAPSYRIRGLETVTQLCEPEVCEEQSSTQGETGLGALMRATWRLARSNAAPYDPPETDVEQFGEAPADPVAPSPQATGEPSPFRPDFGVLAENQPYRFQQFLSGLRRSERPTMHYLHLLLPHRPWHYLPSAMTYPPRSFGGRLTWVKHEWPVALSQQRHLLQVAYTDRLLGAVIDRLEEEGMWQESLVVVTADHGQPFIPGVSGRTLWDRSDQAADLAWVPVFVKEPGQTRGETSDANWEHVDLLPTMADALGVRLPFEVEGVSHLSGGRERTEKYFYNEPGQRLTIDGPAAFDFVLRGGPRGPQDPQRPFHTLYAMGARPDWVGRPLAGLRAEGVDIDGPPSRMTATLDPDLDFDDVDLSSRVVPALIRGDLPRRARGGPVVIAVNGTVGAVAGHWPSRGGRLFAGIVDDALFVDGRNDVALYEVVGGRRPQLRPITVEPAQ